MGWPDRTPRRGKTLPASPLRGGGGIGSCRASDWGIAATRLPLGDDLVALGQRPPWQPRRSDSTGFHARILGPARKVRSRRITTVQLRGRFGRMPAEIGTKESFPSTSPVIFGRARRFVKHKSRSAWSADVPSGSLSRRSGYGRRAERGPCWFARHGERRHRPIDYGGLDGKSGTLGIPAFQVPQLVALEGVMNYRPPTGSVQRMN